MLSSLRSRESVTIWRVVRLFILGTGLLAEEFSALAEDMGVHVEAFVENLDRQKDRTSLCGRPIIWVDHLPTNASCVCALSTTKRKSYIEPVQDRAQFVNLVHPSSTILPRTTLGAGTVVSTGVLIAGHTTIGSYVFLNRGVRVGHHTRVGDFVTIQPGANVAGAIEIGEQAYVGMGALVLERIKIGKGATIAAGALVRDDVPDYAMVAGVPAVIKKREEDVR